MPKFGSCFIIAVAMMAGLFCEEAFAGMWRFGFYWSLTATSYPPSAVPWQKYTHVSQFGLRPNAGCGIDDQSYNAGSTKADFVKTAHANHVLALVTMVHDPSATNMIKCTGRNNIAGFVSAIVNYVNTNSYDGFDLDWETNVPADQYMDLVRRLRAAMPSKLLTTDIAIHQRGYVVPVQAQLDRINLMNYDMYGSDYRGKPIKGTWHHVALASGNDNLNRKSVEANLYYALGSRLDPAKINLGLPFYGYAFEGCELGSKTPSKCMAPLIGPNQSISSEGQKATQVAYSKIVSAYAGAKQVWDPVHKTSYVVCAAPQCMPPSFVSFMSPQEAKEAVNFAIAKNLGGIMTFALHQEYMPGQSGDARYPLSSTIYNALAQKGKL